MRMTMTEEGPKDRTSLWFIIASLIGLGIVLWAGTYDASPVVSLYKNDPSQAFLFSVLLSLFVWTFSTFFNSFMQHDRTAQTRLLRKDLSELKSAMEKQAKEIQALRATLTDSGQTTTLREKKEVEKSVARGEEPKTTTPQVEQNQNNRGQP